MTSARLPMAESPSDPTLDTVDALLQGGDRTFERIAREQELPALMRVMVLTIMAGAALFGMSIGLYRGGLQVLYAAIKLPLVLLLTTAACAPALTAIGGALERRTGLQRDLALVVAALARTSLTLAALSPVVLLGVRIGIDYHDMVLLVVAACAVAGAVGLRHFWRGLRVLDGRAVFATGAALVCVFSVVGMQLSWTLRPFLVRPRAPDVMLLRAVEGSFFDAVERSAESAAGIYHRDRAPIAGEGEE